MKVWRQNRLEENLANNPLHNQRNLRRTLEYDQAVYLLKLKEVTAERLREINKELKEINSISHYAVMLAKTDVKNSAWVQDSMTHTSADLDVDARTLQIESSNEADRHNEL